jgi:drug/metabolite transporter (DMT)-like permease
MTAFAANSLLCRMALKHSSIDAASFTSIRLISAALTLWLVVKLKGEMSEGRGSMLSALALFAYAAGFSYAYVSLPAATGALLLFGAVQATMIGYGVWMGERLFKLQIAGLLLAFVGLLVLFLPGLSAPSLSGTILMLSAGIAWGIYSLQGRRVGNPVKVSAGNFQRAVPITVVLSLIMINSSSLDSAGVLYAILSGVLASALGYVLWYQILPHLKATNAATVQLSVPVITALGGVVFLGEAVTLQLTLASIAILGGIALVILNKA